jgi:hypothetical protein
MTIDDIVTRRRSRRWRVAMVACLLVVAAVLGPTVWWVVQKLVYNPDASEPSCYWPAHIEHANSGQAELIRCYLRAIAHHSMSGLFSVVPSADDGGPTGFNRSDFAHEADARSGTATVTVIPNENDSGDATVAIRFADGARESLEIYLANPTSYHSWRFNNLGKYPNNPSAPPPASQ